MSELKRPPFILLIAVLGSACGGGNPLQEQGQACEPALGSDACVDGLICEHAAGAKEGTCKLPHVQQVSEACDPSYGIDACGAELFCAAFDGRKDATCYALYTRRPGQGCLAADNCANARCTAGACEVSAEGEPCLADSECQSGLRCDLAGVGGGYCTSH